MEKKVDFTRDVIMIGVVEKGGTFTDDNGKSIDYHNFLFYFCEPLPDDNFSDNVVSTYGAIPFELKIKVKDLNRIFGVKDFAIDFDSESWVGDTYNIVYGRDGVTSISRNMIY